MEWMEINCLISALEALIEKYRTSLKDGSLSEDEHSNVANDLAYAEILLGKYEALRSSVSTI